MKNVVLLGGGHSHVEVLRDFGSRRLRNPTAQNVTCTEPSNRPSSPLPPSNTQHPPKHERREPPPPVALTVVSRGRFTPYSGMLPGWVSGFYSYQDCHIDLGRLADWAGARLVTAEATGLDLQGRRVLFGGEQDPVPYDLLSVNVGITPGSAGVPGAHAHATPVKPIDGFVTRFEELLERFREGAATAAADLAPAAPPAAPPASSSPATPSPSPPAAPLRVCVVGGGAGGVELAAAVRYRLQEELRTRADAKLRDVSTCCHVSLVSRGAMLAGHPPHVRRLVRRLLTDRGVEVLEGDAVVRVRQSALELQSGGLVPYDECLWCTEASPAAWLRGTGLPTDPGGFLLINDKLQSDGGPREVFAAGDAATCAAHPRPKAGVYAVRQGPPLAANLRSFLEGQPLEPFVPQRTSMALISLGDRFCVISRTGPGAGTRGGPSPSRRSSRDASDADADGDEWPLAWLLNGFGGRLAGLTGPLLWRWKDSIDRAFMCKYGELLGTAAGQQMSPRDKAS